ncbi:MAG: hypothetical protein CMF38_00600 [Legionellaceae bacterium]|nr:hypothetical protein [Legionellaceae bacterium]HCA88795.1 hypothetical protein [Legionellales bacterium]|tara:strand:- start:4372 stop:4866 length:495 start_codon:yes stop_codon:yes gene_type:complete
MSIKALGFSLIELLAVLAITLLLLSITVYTFTPFWQQKNLETRQNDLVNIIRYAKIMSYNAQNVLYLQPISPNDWSKGIRLIKNISNFKADILHEWRWQGHNISLSWHGFQTAKRLIFARDIRQASLSGHFILKHLKTHVCRAIIVNRLGHTRIENCSTIKDMR